MEFRNYAELKAFEKKAYSVLQMDRGEIL